MRRVWLLLFLAVWTLAACGGAPTQVGDSAVDTLGSVLDWDRSPTAVIVRLETRGNSGDPTIDLNQIPFCTLFGDGRVVWTDPFADPEQVLEDRIGDETFRNFLQYVIGTGFYSWTSDTGFQPPTSPAGIGPIVETITLTLYGETRTLDAFSNWPPDAFSRILERCRTLSSTPVLYQPQGVWVSAVVSQTLDDIPSLPWEAWAEAYPDFDLAAIPVGSPRWVTGDLARVVWRIAREGRMQVMYNNVAYQLVVQDPTIQPNAPPAPAP